MLDLPSEVKVFTDGASRGNPGPASIGIVFYDSSHSRVGEHCEKLGEQTNNYAEYMAVIRALELCDQAGVETAAFYCDSQLLVRQMIGQYKVKAPQIIPLYQQAKELCQKLKNTEFHHVKREQNKEADALANQALDSH